VSSRVIQGWHSDPFGLHEARYFSADGQPTKLVRDGGRESYHEPPSDADEVAAAMTRLATLPQPPSAAAPRDARAYGSAAERGPRRPSIAAFAAAAVILAAAGLGVLFVATLKHGSTQDATDAAFVTQAATRTLQQHTAYVVLTGGTTSGDVNIKMHGTGAFDLGGKAGTLTGSWNVGTDAVTFREVLLNGYAYLAIKFNGLDFLPKGKTWIAEQVTSQEPQTPDLISGDPTAAIASLEKHGITVSALGTKVIGGVNCTGYSVTPPDEQGTITVWIDPQHLVQEASWNEAAGIVSTATSGSVTPAIDITMDFSYSAAPLDVTAPPAASTEPYNAYLQQFGEDPVPTSSGSAT
jgi:hypothetical protein